MARVSNKFQQTSYLVAKLKAETLKSYATAETCIMSTCCTTTVSKIFESKAVEHSSLR